MEMAAGNYVTAIMTCCDTADGWRCLWDALKEIDDFCVAADEPVQENRKPLCVSGFKTADQSDGCAGCAKRRCRLQKRQDRQLVRLSICIRPEFQLWRPGEQITQEAVDVITRYRQMNLPVQESIMMP